MNSTSRFTKVSFVLLLLLLFWVSNQWYKGKTPSNERETSQQLEIAFVKQQSNIQVKGSGTIIKLLPDDIKGARHQKIVVRVNQNQTVLIAHNIDLAPRVEAVERGEQIFFAGEYEWNEKGGIIHWTHRDPNHRHPDGWLRYRAKVYQ